MRVLLPGSTHMHARWHNMHTLACDACAYARIAHARTSQNIGASHRGTIICRQVLAAWQTSSSLGGTLQH